MPTANWQPPWPKRHCVEGENQIFDIEGKKTTFTAKCEKGLCSTPNVKSNGDFTEEGSPTVDAWKRKCDKNLCIDANGTEYPLDKKSGIAKIHATLSNI